MNIKYRFALGARVWIPGKKNVQGVITACGTDHADGNWYAVEYVRERGRPSTVSVWEDQLVKANAASRGKAHRKPKAAKSKKRSGR